MKSFASRHGVSESNLLKIVSTFAENTDNVQHHVSDDNRALVVTGYRGVELNFTFQDCLLEDCYVVIEDKLVGVVKHIRKHFDDADFSFKLRSSVSALLDDILVDNNSDVECSDKYFMRSFK